MSPCISDIIPCFQVRCYLRLSDNTRACEALCQCLPDQLKDETFANCLKVSGQLRSSCDTIAYGDTRSYNMFANHRVLCQDDKSTKHWLAQLLKNIETMGSTGAGAGAGQQSLKGAQGTKLAQPVA